MQEKRIQQISNDIKAYKEVIENAEGALAQAERELVEEYDSTFDDSIEYPEE